ncbi:MAG TPA: hypothetical protein VFP84_00190 [Kofleriaceae bacterium]|nr:hypothetical protein [Kofleriaceae bacterium]
MTERVARADDALALARKAVDESDYATARTQLAAARDAGGHRPDETAELYRLTGIVSAVLGDAAAATEAFKNWLAIAPKGTLPAGTSPKITRPFDAAAKYLASHGALELKIETSGNPPVITLVTVNDPLHLVARAHVVFAVDVGAEQAKDVTASDRTLITLPAGGRIDARVSALDEHGNHLVELGSKDVPIVIIGEKPAPAPVVTATAAPIAARGPARPLPIYRKWWPYATAAVVVGGVSGLFAYRTRRDSNDLQAVIDQSSVHTFGEAKKIQDRGDRDALITNLSAGVAGAFAITAGLMYLVAPRAHTETRIGAVPIAGGATVVLGGAL